MMVSLFQKWLASDLQPVVFDAKELRSVCPAIAALAPCGLVHGIEDHRGRYDCMYLFLGPWELASPLSRQLCRVVLPFIDAGFRQLPEDEQAHPQEQSTEEHVPGTQHSINGPSTPPTARPGNSHWDGDAGERGSALSRRELEIMHWVRMGKTNSEIAIILNLSTFTVKNHMRRIYKKLDVLNRAQAVGNLDRLQGTSQLTSPPIPNPASASSRALVSMRNTA
jgi:DNA-binding CsgD family transcriptional regulator